MTGRTAEKTTSNTAATAAAAAPAAGTASAAGAGAESAGSAQGRGFFIVIEGGEGAGKTTQLATVKSCMQELGFEVVCTREPGGTKLAEEIRAILLTKDEEEQLCSTSELLLMYAARAQLVRSKIKPLLSQGVVVISDRFDLSTIAYQGYGRGFDLREIATLRELAIGDFKPDLTLLFDVDVDVGMQRVMQRSSKDRIEEESRQFFVRVRQGYCDYAKDHPDEVKVIDAGRSVEEVSAQVRAVLQERFGRGPSKD